jgi:hypothetical protein
LASSVKLRSWTHSVKLGGLTKLASMLASVAVTFGRRGRSASADFRQGDPTFECESRGAHPV